MKKIHNDAAERVAKNRVKQIAQDNKKTNVVTLNFEVWDFILVDRAQHNGHKQSFRWVGARRIVDVVGECALYVEQMLKKIEERIHAARLILFRADKDGKDVSHDLMSCAANSEGIYELDEELDDICGSAEDGMHVLVKWAGLLDRKDWTWQDLEELHENISEVITAFLKTCRQKRFVRGCYVVEVVPIQFQLQQLPLSPIMSRCRPTTTIKCCEQVCIQSIR